MFAAWVPGDPSRPITHNNRYFPMQTGKSSFSLNCSQGLVMACLNINSLLRHTDDKIPSKLLKIGGDILAPSLTVIFSRSLSIGIFPHDWKSARVSPIFKGVAAFSSTNIFPSLLSLLRLKYLRN